MNGTKRTLIRTVGSPRLSSSQLTTFVAEDNPANDYPEDEVSSDDEFGLGSYNHRRNASDNEEYDFDRMNEEKNWYGSDDA